jgi:hypothetical protein
MVAPQRRSCVVVDGGKTFPGDRVESVERGFPDAGLDAIERGHVDAATTAPDVERVGVGVMDGSCADAGYGNAGERGGGVECACRGGVEIEDVEGAVDGDARAEFARVEEEMAGVGYGGAVGRAGM